MLIFQQNQLNYYYFNSYQKQNKHVIYKEGDIPDQIYFVKKGEVEISKSSNLDELLQKDSSLELLEWKNQRKALIYKLNKIKQLKDKFESILRIQVVILGFNNFFGEEDIFLDSPIRASTAKVISSQAEIFSIDKQKLLSDLSNHQTLEGFNQEFHTKYKQQQISFEKNVAAALAYRKSQVIRMKPIINKQVGIMNQIQSPSLSQNNKSQTILLPNIFHKKNPSIVQQAFGFISNREDINQEQQNQNSQQPTFIYNIQKNFETLNSMARQNFLPLRTSLGDVSKILKPEPKESFQFQSNNNSEIKSSQFLYRNDNRTNFNSKVDITNSSDRTKDLIYYPGSIQNGGNIELKRNQSNPINSNSIQKTINNYWNNNSNDKGELQTQKSKKFKDIFDKMKEGVRLSIRTSHSKTKSTSTLNEMRQNFQTIRKYENSSDKSDNVFSQLKNIDDIFYQNQLKLLELNTRSLDLNEISSELLKVYLQKHSQQQVNETLQNIRASRLLSISSILKKGSNNSRLFMKQTEQFKEAGKINNQKTKTDRCSKTNSIDSFNNTNDNHSTNSNCCEIKPSSQKKINRRPKNLSVVIQSDNSPKNNENKAFNRKLSVPITTDYQEQQLSTLKEGATCGQKAKLKNNHETLPMTTTMQYKYFKKQVDFLENSEKYIEQIKQSSGNIHKLNEMQSLNVKSRDESPLSTQINQRQAEQALNQSISLLAGEIFKGSASSIKDIKLQRHHSVILSGGFTSLLDISSKSAQLNLTQKKHSSGDNDYFLKQRNSFRLQSQNSQKSDEDGEGEREKSKEMQDLINGNQERLASFSMSISNPQYQRAIEETQNPLIKRKQSLFSRKGDNLLQQMQSQKIQRSDYMISSFNTSPKNNELLENNKMNTKKISSQFKIETHEQVANNLKHETPLLANNQSRIETSQQNPTTLKNILMANDSQKQKSKFEFLNQIKNSSQPIIDKILKQIQDIKKEKKEEVHYLSKSIKCNRDGNQHNQSSQVYGNHKLCDSPSNAMIKYKNNINYLKGDQQHYQKIIDKNNQKKALFKQAKLCDRNSHYNNNHNKTEVQNQPIIILCLQAQSKFKSKQKINNQ